MRCKNCHYSLENLTVHRCPECGTTFDPNDPSTLAGEPFQWGTFLFRTASGHVILLLLLAFLATDDWPWHRLLDHFKLWTILLFLPVTLVNLLTLKWLWVGWLMALMLAGFVASMFMPALVQ